MEEKERRRRRRRKWKVTELKEEERDANNEEKRKSERETGEEKKNECSKKKSQGKFSVLNFHSSTILTFPDPHCVIHRRSLGRQARKEPILRFLPLSHESVARIGEKD